MVNPAVTGEPDLPDLDLITTLEQIAAVVAVDAAAFIVQERPHDLAAATKSSATDLVTVMDQAAQERILDTLGRLRPQGRRPRRGVRWAQRDLRHHLGRGPHRRNDELRLQLAGVCRVDRRRRRRPHRPRCLDARGGRRR